MRPAILAVMVALAPAIATAQVRHGALPAVLLGKWSQDLHRCTNLDDPVIVLSAKTYINSKVNCTIHWVSEIPSTRGTIYSAHMQCSSTTASSDKTISNLILLPTDNNHILVGPGFGNLTGYERCSAEPVNPQ